MRRTLLSLVTGVLLLLVTAQVALAAKPVFHEVAQVHDTFPEVLCATPGIPGTGIPARPTSKAQ